MKLRFGVFELDEAAGELRRAGRPVPLQPKPFALLALLLRERARVVPAQELMQALWPDTFVTTASLTRAVSSARRAIDDTGRGERIKSVARRGYRFHGEVVEVDAKAAATASPESGADRPARARPGFVGRREPLAALGAALDDAAAGKSAVAIVSGAAGIGKTHLCEVFAEEARGAGFFVVPGRCRDRDGAPAFWLWAQILQRVTAEESFRDAIAALAGDGRIAALVPALRDYAPTAAPGNVPAEDGLADRPAEQKRFLLFDAATRALCACASQRPMLLLLEDIQWAGWASLRLLEHLASELSDAPVLIVASVRDEPRCALRRHAARRGTAA